MVGGAETPPIFVLKISIYSGVLRSYRFEISFERKHIDKFITGCYSEKVAKIIFFHHFV